MTAREIQRLLELAEAEILSLRAQRAWLIRTGNDLATSLRRSPGLDVMRDVTLDRWREAVQDCQNRPEDRD